MYFMLCPFGKIVIVGSPLGCIRSLIRVLSQIYSTRHEFHPMEMSWNANKTVGCSCNIQATIAPMGVSCLVITGAWRFTPGWAMWLFSSSSQQSTFSVMKATHWGGSFQIISSLISSSLVIKVCGICSNRLLPWSACEQPRENGNNLYYFRSLYDLLHQQKLEGRYPTPGG